MSLPDFESMSVDDLVEWRVAKKKQIEALKEEIRASNPAYREKINVAAITARIKATGLEGVVVIPGPSLAKIRAGEAVGKVE